MGHLILLSKKRRQHMYLISVHQSTGMCREFSEWLVLDDFVTAAFQHSSIRHCHHSSLMQFEHRLLRSLWVRTIISTLWAICLKKCCHCASVCPSVCLSVCASYVFSLPGEITTKQRWLPLALDQQNVNTSDAPPPCIRCITLRPAACFITEAFQKVPGRSERLVRGVAN